MAKTIKFIFYALIILFIIVYRFGIIDLNEIVYGSAEPYTIDEILEQQKKINIDFSKYSIDREIIEVFEDMEYNVSKNFNQKDKSRLRSYLSKKREEYKDIIVFLDFDYSNNKDAHGKIVLDSFFKYFHMVLNKEPDVQIITLTFKDSNSINDIDIVEYDKISGSKRILEESYPLENYISAIRELSPRSKILLSTSFIKSRNHNNLVNLSNIYDFKISKGFLNDNILSGKDENRDKIDFHAIYWFNFIMDRTNTILVALNYFKPEDVFSNTIPKSDIKTITLNNLKLYQELSVENKVKLINLFQSSSELTPILGYEYYINDKRNLVFE